eukprot:3376860-Pleurochrysis_carterae.AAC.3
MHPCHFAQMLCDYVRCRTKECAAFSGSAMPLTFEGLDSKSAALRRRKNAVTACPCLLYTSDAADDTPCVDL